MKRTVVIILILSVAALTSSGLSARLLKEWALADRLGESDIVVIARAERTKPARNTPGIEEYSELRILRVLYGDKSPERLMKLVTRGGVEEHNPACCEVDQTYLIFARAGYELYDMEEGEEEDAFTLTVEIAGVMEFHSSVNGAYGVYPIVGNEVLGWKGTPSKSMDNVTAEINSINPLLLGLIPMRQTFTPNDIFLESDCDENVVDRCSAQDYMGREYVFTEGRLSRVTATTEDLGRGRQLPGGVQFGEHLEGVIDTMRKNLNVDVKLVKKDRCRSGYRTSCISPNNDAQRIIIEMWFNEHGELHEFSQEWCR